MHFVNDVNLVFTICGRVIDSVTQVAHILDTGVRSSINFDQIQKTVFVHCQAMTAGVARPFSPVLVQAVHCLGQQPRSRRLAGAARS